jgi:iron complex transport system permease protein
LQLVASRDSLQGLVIWTMGSLNRSTWTMVAILTTAVVVMFAVSMLFNHQLSSLKLGAERAASFGVNVVRLRMISLGIVGLLAALSVSFTGPIGFVGLCAPHMARLLVGENHLYFLPASALIGALLLSLSSIISKIVITGAIIPIGIVTSIIGIPFFLIIMIKQRHLC